MAEPAKQIEEQLTLISTASAWIRYPRAEQIIADLEALLAMPKQHRMPNLIIAGPSNNGKSSILDRFYAAHQPDVHLAGGGSNVPVILFEMPDVPDVSGLYNDLLRKLFVPFRTSSPLDMRRSLALRSLDLMQVKMIVIDELHHIVGANANKQRQILQMIKHLGNELMIPIVAAGTRAAYNAIQMDPQLANRFEVALLPRWTLDNDFLSLLAAFELLLPIDAREVLTRQDVALKILSLSEGTIGDVAKLLIRATRYAIKRGYAKLDYEIITDCGFIPQSIKNRVDGID